MSQSKAKYVKTCSEDDVPCSNIPELEDLPHIVLVEILRHLDANALRKVSRISRKLQEVAHSTPKLWSKSSLFIATDSDESIFQTLEDTPILQCLYMQFGPNYGNPLREEEQSRILAALTATKCKIYKLSGFLGGDLPKFIQVLQKHSEIRELDLRNKVYYDNEEADNDFASRLAVAISRLPNLITLDLSQLNLIRMPNAGVLLASAPGRHGVDEHPQDLGPLDLRDVDAACEHEPEKPFGLVNLTFRMYHLQVPVVLTNKWSATGTNLAKLIRAHKQSLKNVELNLLCKEVCLALGECTRVEKLWVHCGLDGVDFCAMMKTMAMKSTLRRLHLELPAPMTTGQVATVLRTVARHAPCLEVLWLSSLDEENKEQEDSDDMMNWDDDDFDSWPPFPGFEPLRDLLEGREGCAGLRELRLMWVHSLSFPQIQELAPTERRNANLSLRKLEVSLCDCNKCARNDDDYSLSNEELAEAFPWMKYDPTQGTLVYNALA